jgi:tetratricopeptide (TPR) repeat protein
MAKLDNLAGINEEDFLFVWIMSNGGNTDPADNVWSYVYLWGYDPAHPNDGRLYDYELKAKLDLIPAHKKVVVVQAPNSGKFATTCADDNTIVITSSHSEEPSTRANDTPYEENEEWNNVKYHHGEFGYHLYSPLRGKNPGLGNSYGTTAFSTANTYNDDVISIDEGIDWLINNHNTTEPPVVSDPNNMSYTTAVQYSTLIFGEIYSDITYIGTLGLTGLPPQPGQSTTAIGHWSGNLTFSKANLYFLDDTRFYKVTNNYDLLYIDDNVTLFGTNGASGLVSYSTIEFGTGVTFTGLNGERWGGLAVQNPELYFNRTSFIDCYAILNTIPTLIFKGCHFERAGLLGQYLYGYTQISDDTYFLNSYADLNGYGRENSILIKDSHFDGPSFNNTSKGIYMKTFINYSIESNIIQDYGHGLYLFRCSGPKNSRDITNNSIHGNSASGIFAYNSYANIFDNPGIYENGVGIQCNNYSNVEIEGNQEAVHISETQRIHDNTGNQIRADEHSFPYLKWNAIWKNYNTEPLVYWDIEMESTPEDISNNFWGDPQYFDPKEDFYPVQAFDWEPVWEIGYGLPPKGNDELLYEEAGAKAVSGDFAGAKSDYMQLISDYTDSPFAEASLKELLPLEYDVSNDYASLRQYYLNDPDILGNDMLNAVAVNLANWCYVEMEDYISAIQYFNDILANPPSYHDSLYAIIDIDYIYYLMNINGYKSSLSDNSLIFDMTSKEQHDEFIDYHNALFFPQKELSKELKNKIGTLGSGELIQNYPNPFNNQTEIWFKLDRPANVILNVYNFSGKLISSINEGEVTGGNHNVVYSNKELSPGLYFYTLVTDGIISDTKKMTLIR